MTVDFYRDIETPENPALVTPFTLFHFIMGLVAYIVLKFFLPNTPDLYTGLVWFGLHSIYELKDIFAEGTTNSALNSLGDTIAAMGGFFAGMQAFKNKTVKLENVLQIVLLAIIAQFIIPEPAS